MSGNWKHRQVSENFRGCSTKGVLVGSKGTVKNECESQDVYNYQERKIHGFGLLTV